MKKHTLDQLIKEARPFERDIEGFKTYLRDGRYDIGRLLIKNKTELIITPYEWLSELEACLLFANQNMQSVGSKGNYKSRIFSKDVQGRSREILWIDVSKNEESQEWDINEFRKI